MSILAPLYVLGALAVSLPILFHLIRRTPSGRLLFSSLMFLRPSPPRITRRSRLDNWLLLLLRAAALCLLALAFARPFLRGAASASAAAGRRVAVLVDASASMRRGDLWARALERVDAALDEAAPADRFSVWVFDDGVRPLLGLDDPIESSVAERRALVRRLLEDAGPTWGATDLGGALVTVADSLEAFDAGTRAAAGEGGPRASVAGTLEIILVSDLQQGSRLEALAAYVWPQGVRLAVDRVSVEAANAGLGLLGGGERDPGEGYRVRIVNEGGSSEDRFSLRWEPRPSATAAPELTVEVPPGESRDVTVREPEPDPGTSSADRLVLAGDDHDFDNTVHVVPPRRETVTVVWVGPESGDDPTGPRYYLERALGGDRRREVSFVSPPPEHPFRTETGRPPRLAVVVGDAPEALDGELLEFARAGGTVLCVLADATATRTVSRLLGRRRLAVEEAATGDYAMLAEIDFGHPLFAPLADPRFSDFTGIRFWRHRRVSLDGEQDGDVDVLARFDDGDPAILERELGAGRVLVLTSGWHPADSQLALSTKFVPLAARLLESRRDADRSRTAFRVHDPVPLPVIAAESAPRAIRKPDGTTSTLAADDAIFSETDLPGAYSMEAGGEEWRFAVNLAPAESRTAPLSVEDLEQHGVRTAVPAAAEAERRRRLLDVEIEGSQKLWQWLVAAALVALLLETWLGGRVARISARGEPAREAT